MSYGIQALSVRHWHIICLFFVSIYCDTPGGAEIQEGGCHTHEHQCSGGKGALYGGARARTLRQWFRF